ncbi:MAG: hypothetical protein K1X29_03135 [Bdellovibrionales bacterium]|nr:hypothetical protein [Bdellovibrionales bacterium]
MFRSKLKLFLGVKFIFLFIGAVTLSGCWKARKSEVEAPTSFRVLDVKGEAQHSRGNQKLAWNIPRHRTINFTACLKDLYLDKEILHKDFQVEIPEESRKTDIIRSNDQGCILWQETWPYNYYAVIPAYVKIIRKIHGVGVNPGVVEVPLFINPWARERDDNLEPVIFEKTRKIDPSFKVLDVDRDTVLSGKYGGAKPKLWVGDFKPVILFRQYNDEYIRTKQVEGGPPPKMREDFDDKAVGMLLEIAMEMSVKVEVQDFRGNPYYMKIEKGDFLVNSQLVAATPRGESGEDRLLLTPRSLPGVGKIIGNDYHIEVSTHVGITSKVTTGNLEIALKVEPFNLKNGPELEPFSRVYTLGDVNSLLKTGQPRAVKEFGVNFDYEKYLASTLNFNDYKNSRRSTEMKPFIFEIADVKFTGIKPGETATVRTVKYSVTTCIRETLTNERARLREVHVLDETGAEMLALQPDGSFKPHFTTDEGCLVFNSSETHKYYTPTVYHFRKFIIRVSPRSGSPTLQKNAGGDGELELAINPWDTQFRTFGWDKRQFSEEFINELRKQQKPSTNLFITEYRYTALNFDYEIDKYLDLSLKKEVLFNLEPQVLRYSDFLNGRKIQKEPLRDGIYLMKVAIYRDYLDSSTFVPHSVENIFKTTLSENSNDANKKTFITAVERLVRVNAGEINANVIFTIRDLRLMRARCHFFVQFEAIDEEKLIMANFLYENSLKVISAANDKDKLNLLKAEKEKIENVLSSVNVKITDLQRSIQVKKPNGTSPPGMSKFLTEALDNTIIGKSGGDALAPLSIKDAGRDALAHILEPIQLVDMERNQLFENLIINDFTKTEIAPIVNLELLVDKSSGLPKRAFVGPILFLSNSYSDRLRPTDNLEIRCVISHVRDCDQLKMREGMIEKELAIMNADYNSSSYGLPPTNIVGDLRLNQSDENIGFANKTLDDLISDEKKIKENHQKDMDNYATLPNMLSYFNYKFFSYNSQYCNGDSANTHESAQECEQMGKNTIERSQLFSDTLAPIPQSSDWEGLFEQGQVSVLWYKHLCSYFSSFSKNRNLFLTRCMRSGGGHEVANRNFLGRWVDKMQITDESIFRVEKKIRVFEVSPKFEYLGGRPLNVSVTVSDSFSQSESASVGTSFSVGLFDAGSSVTSLASPDTAAAKATKWLSGIFSLTTRSGRDSSQSSGFNAGASTAVHLAMDMASFRLQMTKYERCALISLRPIRRLDLEVIGLSDGDSDSWFKVEKTGKRPLMNEKESIPGLFLCKGQIEENPLFVDENYFYFNQTFVDGGMTDPQNLKNNPWLVSMRSNKDFYSFMSGFPGKRVTDENVFSLFFNFPATPVFSGEEALTHMIEAYKRFMPSFHGIYTYPQEQDPLQNYPAKVSTEIRR